MSRHIPQMGIPISYGLNIYHLPATSSLSHPTYPNMCYYSPCPLLCPTLPPHNFLFIPLRRRHCGSSAAWQRGRYFGQDKTFHCMTFAEPAVAHFIPCARNALRLPRRFKRVLPCLLHAAAPIAGSDLWCLMLGSFSGLGLVGQTGVGLVLWRFSVTSLPCLAYILTFDWLPVPLSAFISSS